MPSSEARKERRLHNRLRQLDPTKREPDPIDVYLQRWVMKLTALALTRRTWEGLPEEIDERYLEKTLLTRGSAIIYSKDESPIAQAMSFESGFDAQENIPERSAWGADGTNENNLTDLDSVIIYDNSLRTPVYSELLQYARDLAKHDLEIMRNVHLQNSFFMLLVPREMKADGERLMRNMGMGVPGMLAADDEILKNIEPKTLSTGVAPLMADLNESKDHLYNEACAFLGIDYVPFEKKERLVTAEAEMAGDIIERQREFFLFEAEKACERMHDVFGWNVSVKWNTFERTKEPEQEPELVEESGASDESYRNNAK